MNHLLTEFLNTIGPDTIDDSFLSGEVSDVMADQIKALYELQKEYPELTFRRRGNSIHKENDINVFFSDKKIIILTSNEFLHTDYLTAEESANSFEMTGLTKNDPEPDTLYTKYRHRPKWELKYCICYNGKEDLKEKVRHVIEVYNDKDDFNTKEWWMRKLNAILEDSDYEAVINQKDGSRSVIVVLKGTLRPQLISVWPKKNAFSVVVKKDIYYQSSVPSEFPLPNEDKEDGYFQEEGKRCRLEKITEPKIVFSLAEVLADGGEWIPPLSEYDPKITKEMWLDFFRNSGRFNDNYQHMMAAMLGIGGQASCIQLEERFGKSSDHYRATAVQMADKAHIYFNTPLYKDKSGKEQLWPLLFTGRKTSKEERGNFIWKLRPPLKEALKEFGIEKEGESAVTTKQVNIDKNLILYGPPGTGKTYSAAIYAVAICDGKSIDELTDYEAVMARYNALKEEGRIAFTTFHQSYGYEEFIEGIKPYTDENTKAISYSVEPGVFKSFCESARKKTVEGNPYEIPDNASIWKVTLRKGVIEDCFDHDRVRINWDIISEGANSFVNDMNPGDIILTTDGSRTVINGIAIVAEGEAYQLDAQNDKTTRNVKWIAKSIHAEIVSINTGKQFNRITVHRIPHMDVSDVLALAKENNRSLSTVAIETNTKPYVFIIDEINRGNISKIFGELITLIEETKRDGMPEAASAILPYSGESFSVPGNVWLLGTMNTADRSIALMDTALRRRFGFAERMPDADVLRKIGADKVGDLDVAAMLDKINERITFLYDREHTIGHAFFTGLKDEPTLAALSAVFRKSVIPLLQEYFYEDYQKIQLVLGDNAKTDDSLKFIKDEKVNIRQIFKGSADELIDIEKRYTINDAAFDNIESYIQIL